MWPAAERIETARLRLDPLRVADADEMAGVLWSAGCGAGASNR
jgi:hypothetical protein